MCLTIIDTASNWFEIVKLPVVKNPCIGNSCKTQKRVGRTNNKTQEAIRQTKEACPLTDSFMINKLVT